MTGHCIENDRQRIESGGYANDRVRDLVKAGIPFIRKNNNRCLVSLENGGVFGDIFPDGIGISGSADQD